MKAFEKIKKNLKEVTTTIGFTDSLSPTQAARAEKLLLKLIRSSGMTSMISTIAMELASAVLCGAYTESKKTEKGTEYRLYVPFEGEKVFWELKKTEYNFCQYVAENFSTVEEIIMKDKEIKEAEERRGLEEEEKRAEEEAVIKHIEEEAKNFRNWLWQESKKVSEDKKAIITKVYERLYDKSEYAIDYGIAVLINNFDDQRCKEEVINRLRPHNKATSILFTMFTGLRLPATYKDRVEFLNGITSNDFIK